MLIEGPLNIDIVEPADGQGKILTVGFQPEFQALALDEQGRNFREYLDSLAKEVAAITDDNDRDRMGMLIIQQFAEQLLPHIEAGELALEETMNIQIGRDDQTGALVDLLGRIKPL